MEAELHYMISLVVILSGLLGLVSLGSKGQPPRYRR